MKEELELSLRNKYPQLCRDYKGDPKNTCMAWGFDCGDGWYALLDDTLNSIEKIVKKVNLDIKLAQVKSKFGKLTIHIDISEGPNGPHIQQAIQQIHSLIDDARNKSSVISEISGLPATQHIINSYIYTVTDSEAEELKLRAEVIMNGS
jgi:hypothetical protein